MTEEEKAAAKAQKEQERAAAKAKKEQEKADAKAQKAQQEQEKADAKEANAQQEAAEVEEEEYDDEAVQVEKFEHGGDEYLRSADNVLYDPETHAPVGRWDEGETPEQIGYLDPNEVLQHTGADITFGILILDKCVVLDMDITHSTN